ncbi:MAG: M16 family metallopeptidase [Alphaproteobacteria bacterium]
MLAWLGRATAVLVVLLIWLAPSPARAVEVQRVVSRGGIEAWLVEDHTLPIISLQLAFRGGAALDPPGKEGLAEMTSSLIDEGAGDLDSENFQKLLEDLSITLTFDGFIDTFRGRLRTLTRNRDQAFELLRLALNEPRFDEPAVERIRSQILALLARQANDPDRIAGNAFWATVFPDHPYGRPRRGTPESVAAITIEDMRRFVAERFARDNLIIGVVGDVTAEELATLLDETFGPLPARSAAVEIGEVTPAAAGEVMVIEHQAPQSTIIFGHSGLKRDDPDYYAAYVLNHILGGGSFTSRLYDEVREKRGLAYSVGSYLSPFDHTAMWMGSAGTANESVGQSVDVIRREWARIHDEGVTAEELEETRTNLTGAYALRFGNSMSIARMLVGIQLEDLGIDYIDRRNSLIEAVTLEDLHRVAARVLDPDALTFVIVGQPEGVGAGAAEPQN